MGPSDNDCFGNAFQPISDLINAKQDLMDAFHAMSALIDAEKGFTEPKMPKAENPPQFTELRECSVLTEAESILKENLVGNIDRLHKALLKRYSEAFQKQDWKQAHDLLFHGVVKLPNSYESDYLLKAAEWIAKAENLLA